MMILTDNEAWSERLHKSDEIICLSNSPSLAQRNIKSITKFDSWELLAYFIETCMIGVDNSKLKESVMSLRVLAYVK